MNDAQRERIKLCVRGLYDAQKLRIQLELRIARLVRDDLMTEDEAKAFFHLPFGWFEKAEHEMEKMVNKETKDLPIVKKWLRRVRGIGPRLSGLLIANIYDIERFASPGKLYAYCGLHVKDGRAVKRAKGEKANWNAELKTTCWKIGQSFVTAGGPYRALYDRYKARIIEREETKGNVIYTMVKNKWIPISQNLDETQGNDASQRSTETQEHSASHMTNETHRLLASQRSDETQREGASQSNTENQAIDASPKAPEWTLGRINNMAIRYIAKRLLSHLWEVWRELEGLPVRDPYPIEYLGHQQKDDPWKYVEEVKKPAKKKSKAA